MAWVKAEYAGELAVVSAWIAALVPWSLSLQSSAPFGSFFFAVRWPLFELQVRIPATVEGDPQPVAEALTDVYPGSGIGGGLYVTEPLSGLEHYGSDALINGNLAWLVGAGVVLVAVGLSLALYLNEAGTAERLGADPVRLMAQLLGVTTVAFAAASVLYWLGPDYVGTPIPIGVIVVGALAVVLARVERV
jgi:hypothetical protein